MPSTPLSPRPSPEEATRNIDPREVSEPPEEWSRDTFMRSVRKHARHHRHDDRGDGDDQGVKAS